MKLLLFLLLAGYAVKCDDSNNYYVIQMPEDDPPREIKKPFRVYWNVPTMQCTSKKVPFENLYERFGIIQNANDSFRGEKISILYDPGLFPALLKNETSGKLKFRNGGVPQEGDLEKHLTSFRNVMNQSIQDTNFNGVGIIDFESWRPVFRQNFGVLVPYKDVSYQIEKQRHWWWPESWIKEEAKQRFEEAARIFMQTTLSLAKQVRPNAVWGYYGFPYCFNMAGNHLSAQCADNVPAENDHTYWLWSESTALFPSVYSSRNLTSSQLAQLIAGRVSEAARVRRNGTPILPYFWYRYREGGFLSEIDLQTALQTFDTSEASGFIIWGSSNDVNTVAKCIKLHNYIENVMGPAIAKYTKPKNKTQDVLNDFNVENDTSSETIDIITTSTTTNPIGTAFDENNTTITTKSPIFNENSTILNQLDFLLNETNNNNSNSNKTGLKNVELDPEFHWEPPENYTQDIVKYVEQELNKKIKHDINLSKEELNKSVLNNDSILNLNDSILIDMIMDLFEKTQNNEDFSNETDTVTYRSKNHKKGYPKPTEDDITSTLSYDTSEEITDDYDLETSTYLGTDSPMQQINKNEKKKNPKYIQELLTTTVSSTETEETYLNTEINLDSISYTTENSNGATAESDQSIFYNQNTLFDDEDATISTEFETTTLITGSHSIPDTFSREKLSKDKNKDLPKEINTSKANPIITTELMLTENNNSTNPNLIQELEITTRTSEVNLKNRKKGMPSRNKSRVMDGNPNSHSLTSTSSTIEQVVIHV